MAVDAVFQGAQFEQGVDVEGLGLLDEALNADGPGAGGQASGVFRGVTFVDAELLEVVVVGDVCKAGQLLAGGTEAALDGLQFRIGEGPDAG